MAARLKEYYHSDIKHNLMKQFSFDSIMQVPRLEKIVLNVGLGDALGRH